MMFVDDDDYYYYDDDDDDSWAFDKILLRFSWTQCCCPHYPIATPGSQPFWVTATKFFHPYPYGNIINVVYIVLYIHYIYIYIYILSSI